MPPPLIDLQLVVLSGKGGVGRTVVAAALARVAAAKGRRVLIAQTDAIERLGKMLGQPGPIGSTVRTVAPGIDAVNMTPKESLHQYALLVLKYESVYRALFENRAVRGFLSAIPGLDAYSMLGKAWWHTTERKAIDPAAKRGPTRPKYDLVILDGPATGHTVAMLKIPGAIINAAPAGPLVKDARALRELLSDSARTALVIVTRPEELPARETVELATAARNELSIPLGPLVVNAVPPDRLSTGPAAAVLDRIARPTGDAELDATLDMAANLRAHRETADQVLSSLRAQVEPLLGPQAGPSVVTLPWLPSTELGLREIDQLAAALAKSV
jgi:anion-transporting  ArsA/GET3 family ATPase